MPLQHRAHHPIRPLRATDVVAALLIAVYDLFAASRLSFIKDSSVQPWHSLWPMMFTAAGLTTAWFAWCAHERQCAHLTSALAWSGAFNVTAYASRALVLASSAWRPGAGATDRVQLGVATWTLLTIVAAYMWVCIFKPAVELSKHGG